MTRFQAIETSLIAGGELTIIRNLDRKYKATMHFPNGNSIISAGVESYEESRRLLDMHLVMSRIATEAVAEYHVKRSKEISILQRGNEEILRLIAAIDEQELAKQRATSKLAKVKGISMAKFKKALLIVLGYAVQLGCLIALFCVLNVSHNLHLWRIMAAGAALSAFVYIEKLQ